MADLKREYRKECTVEVNVGDRKNISGSMLIKALRDYVDDVYACVPKGSDCYEVTVPDINDARNLADQDGMEIDGYRIETRMLFSETLVVSFMHLPAYIKDDVIMNFLQSKGIELKGEIQHRMIKGTNISDGTRYVRVKFPDHVKSLPYSVGFHTLDGYKYFRVIHSNQMKVCFKCGSSDHEIKACPEIKCYKCQRLGHISKFCDANLCSICDMIEDNCTCYDDADVDFNGDGDYNDSDSDSESDLMRDEFPPLSSARENTDRQRKLPAGKSPRRGNQQPRSADQTKDQSDQKDKPSVKKSDITSQWSTSTRRHRLRKSIKLSDNAIKENELKNKLRENRKDEMKKKKEEQVNVKRDISDVNVNKQKVPTNV